MKRILWLLAATSALTLSTAVLLVPAVGKEKDQPAARGSIHVRGKPSAAERVALAKISFSDALAAAIAAVPGKALSGELTVEDGILQFEFELVRTDRKVMDVSVDAGNGRVLAIEEGDDD